MCSQRQSRELARATALLASQTEDVSRDDVSDGGAVDSVDVTRTSSAADYVTYIQRQISAAHCE